MTVDIWDLIETQTQAEIYADALDRATTADLPVSTWREDDPTLTEYDFLAEILAAREGVTVELIKAGWLTQASGDWLTVHALEVYGVTREEATYAAGTVTLVNSGGGLYALDAGGLIVKSTLTGKAYHSTVALSLAAGATASVAVVADEPGTDSDAGTDDIDVIVTPPLLGVSITASTPASAVDEQSDASLRVACSGTLGMISPDGPPDAYTYVATNTALTGDVEITRAWTVDDSSTGDVVVFVAGSEGAVSSTAIALAQAAIDVWATPLCVTAVVGNAVEFTQAVTFTASGDDLPADLSASVTEVLAALFSEIPINGVLALSAIYVAIHTELLRIGATNVAVTVSVPAVDYDPPALGSVILLGTVTGTEV
jgi:hypothetical protein